MYPLIETIKVENGILLNLPLHQERMDRSRRGLLGVTDSISLKSIIEVPGYARTGVFKCRVIYGKSVGKVEFIAYQPKRVETLKLVVDNDIDYQYKYSDRKGIEKLLAKKGTCDDILIVKNGLITDTSYSNIVFKNGKNWLTPDKPLLMGTKREYLLATGKIKAKEIKIDDLSNYSKFMLMNAMLDFDEGNGISIENIITHE
jgi:4-amino-4-deoxychorismate lyase